MSKYIRKNLKEVKGLFEKNIKCELVSSLNGYEPREVEKEIVKFDLYLRGSNIARGTLNKKYCVYSGNDKYNITVLE